MNYKEININKIHYFNNKVYYNKEPLIFETDELECQSGIEKYFSRYELQLKIPIETFNGKAFFNFMRMLEESNKLSSNQLAQYKSILDKIDGNFYMMTVKVPSKNDKFQIEIESEKEYLPVSSDVKKGEMVRCKIHVNNLWTYSSNGKLMSGCVMELKEIKIMKNKEKVI